MTFKIECSDEHFRLIVVSPNGEEDYLEAVLYCSVSSVVGSDGVVYGAYLTSSERELDDLLDEEKHKNDIEAVSTMVSQTIKVYDLTNWPTLKAVDGIVTLIATEFDIDTEDDDDDENEEAGAVVDVDPA